jgi:hypothetical protein
MSTREILPNRRFSETIEIEHDGHRFTLSLSRFLGGGLTELFLWSALVGSPVEALARAARRRFANLFGCALAAGQRPCQAGRYGCHISRRDAVHVREGKRAGKVDSQRT